MFLYLPWPLSNLLWIGSKPERRLRTNKGGSLDERRVSYFISSNLHSGLRGWSLNHKHYICGVFPFANVELWKTVET